MYASENYARFRSQQNGGAPPPSSSNGGTSSGPADGMAAPRGGAMGPPSTTGRPRGPPGGGHSGYDAMAMPMGSGPEIPPEELVKSLQPINGNGGGRYPAGGRRGEQVPSQIQMQMQMNMAMERRRNAAMSQAPRGPMGGRPPMQRDGGEEDWPPVGNYESSGPGMNGYLPPVKYRRTGEFDGYDEPRNNNGGGGGGSGGGNGGGPMGSYRVPVNNYDMGDQQLQQQHQQQPQGRRQQLQQPPTQQQQRQQQQQRASYAQYAQSSATPPRTQEEMIMMRQRFLEQQQKQQQQQRYGGPPMEEPMGYRQAGPSSTPPGQGPPPQGAPPSSAAAAWARELEAYDQTRRVHRDMQVPTSQPGGGASMTPQAMAQMRMRGQPMAEHVSSPGSRIVTPAAALHNSQRNNRGMARHIGMPGQAPRGMPAASMANAMRGGETMGMAMEMAGRSESMRPSYEQEMEAMAAVAMARTARSQRGPAVGGGGQGGPMGQRGGMPGPPGAGGGGGPGGFPMQDYEAMAMEREMGGAPGQERRQSRPTSASRSRTAQPGRGVSPHLAEVDAMDEPYLVQDDRYAMPPAAQLRAQAMVQQQQMQQQAPSPAPLALPVPEPAPAPARASKKRKEPAAPSKKQARAEAKEAKAAAKATAKATKSSGKNASKHNDSNSGGGAEPKRRCGRKSMNYSSEQKRERNRAAVKKCRQRQALKYEYLKRKAEVLASENRALSEMLVKNVELDEEKRNSLTRGIQMDILLKIKEIFTQSLPKDFVLNADSIWDLNSVLAVSMPSRCYYGIESIKDFWRTSLRMRNKGKIRSFWAWLFRLPPGDRFTEFTIEPFSSTSNLYFINWTTKSSPPLSGSIVIMFGHGHRVTLHVEIFGWLIWRYLLTNTPFPEPPME